VIVIRRLNLSRPNEGEAQSEGVLPMQAKSFSAPRARFAMCTAMAAALFAGLALRPDVAHAQVAGAEPESTSDAAKFDPRLEKQVASAEKSVAKAPRDASARARLAQAYLAVGRFGSAAQTFEDAVSLGDLSPANTLGMALAYIGAGRPIEARTVLVQARETIPAGDYALALALAGQPAQAVSILSDAVTHGENTAKARQNLAYAYALDGRWHEAKLVAAQDLPADQLDARLSQWALQASTETPQSRVAALLGAPLRGDPGQPAMLALGGAKSTPAMAAAEAPVSAPALVGDELPPARADAPVPQMAAVDPAPLPQAAPKPASVPAPESAPAPQLAAVDAPAPIGRQFVSNPVVQDISGYRRADTPALRKVRERVAQPQQAAAVVTGHHAVQLGAFSSAENAHRAVQLFASRDPRLKAHELQVTEAVVNGRRYWRVAAVGFDADAARSMCSTARGRGRDCFAYAVGRPLPAIAKQPEAKQPEAGERLAQR
jgi:Flp pilus assembly protein TadD